MIKYTIHDTNFKVDINSGELFIERDGNVLVLENHIAIELVEILRQKLYMHKDQNEGVFKRFFK
jgi:hypothetical protein